MVSGLNQQNRNLQFNGQNAVQPQHVQNIQNNNQPQSQNFGTLTIKPDTFESNANDPNFGAIDRETLEKGAQEVQKQVDDNPFTMMFKNMFGIDFNNPKKTLISLGLTLATVIGLAKAGNSKFSTEKLADIGIDISNALKKNNIYTNITGKLKGAKDSVVKFLRKSKTIDDIFETFANRRAKAVNSFAKGTGSGLKRIFSLTAPDTLETAFAKMGGDDAKKIESLKKLVGESKAKEVFDMLGGDTMDVSNKLLHSIGENFGVIKNGVVTDEKGLQTILRQLKAGKITGLDGKLNIDVSEFTNLTMNNGKGIMKIPGDWWPVNLANNIGKKIRGDKWKEFGRGNLGDALIKHSIISGQATSTKIGSLVQQSVLFPTEAISNFVNDKSGLGFFLCGMIMNLYNNVQDAPKEKKAATMADDFMGTIGSLAITTPLACATMYSLATLGNTQGKGIFSRMLRGVGKFFGMGLGQKWQKYANDKTIKGFFKRLPGKTVGFVGGFMRLALIMFVFQGIFGKPFRAAINKVFGKPYDPDEEAALKAQQAQAAAQAEVMKNLNMTEEQMIAKLQAHPEFVAALQNDPQALAAIEQNPVVLLQMIAALPDTPNATQNTTQANKFSNSPIAPSSLLQNHVNNGAAQPVQQIQQTQAAQPVQNNMQAQQEKAPESNEPVRTYIPSSKPFNYVEGDTNTIKTEEITNQNVQTMLSKADKAEMEAMKILG